MEDTELKKLLGENLKTSRESLKILKEINSARKWGRFFFFLKWGIIIGLLIFGFIKIQPYLESLIQIGNTMPQTLQQLQSIPLENFLPR